MSLLRRPGWRSALIATIEGYRRRPFAWGTTDCALFAADGVKAMTGEDLAAGFRGRYTTAEEARALLASLGMADVAALAASVLPEVSPAKARMGDVVALTSEGEWSLGLCNGATSCVLTPKGIGFLPLSAARRAWSV